MKILTAEQTRQADQYTIEHEPIRSTDLMERAATQASRWILNFLEQNSRFERIAVVCGVGNNGGDGLVIARQLSQWQSLPVSVHVANFSPTHSPDFKLNHQRLKGCSVELHEHRQDFPSFSEETLCIDALFGSGLSRPVRGGVAQAAVRALNAQGGSVISIDLPSGLFSEDNTQNTPETIVRARHTLTFERPKLAMLLDANAPFVGTWHCLPIGLHPDFLAHVDTPYHLLTAEGAKALLRPRSRFSHKGTHGHACLMVGGRGTMGAAILAARACLRSGVGLLTSYVPRCGYEIIQLAVPESMSLTDPHSDCITQVPEHLSNYEAVGAGCGWGQSPESAQALEQLLEQAVSPLVLDADALNLLARHPAWLPKLPKGSILTPHPKEFSRLFGDSLSPYEQLTAQQGFAQKYAVCLIFKGAFTRIALPDGSLWFNYQTGNPGMATGGSGDALTGILTGLLAQGYPADTAAKLGVYLHGLAGDIAARKQGERSLLPSDLIEALGQAYQQVSTTSFIGD